MSDVCVNQRAQQILKKLVERYIQEGTPVGSKTLAEECALGLSPATIRNILADLEDLGLLASPHPSAGRIPTALGYRFFVNSLVSVNLAEEDELALFKNRFNPDLTLSNLLQSASSLLSTLTKLTGVVTIPPHNRLKLSQVEFLSLSEKRILVILVLNNREVQNRIIHTERIYPENELQQVANYLNSHYAGKSLVTIRKQLRAAIQEDRKDMEQLLKTVIDVGHKIFSDQVEPQDYVMMGQNYLLNYSGNEHDLNGLRSLFHALTQKQEILTLLDQALEAEGIQIFIGKESGYDIFDECSIVTASYEVDGQLLGSLGVIGLTRMPYDRVIKAVDVTQKLLSAALNQE